MGTAAAPAGGTGPGRLALLPLAHVASRPRRLLDAFNQTGLADGQLRSTAGLPIAGLGLDPGGHRQQAAVAADPADQRRPDRRAVHQPGGAEDRTRPPEQLNGPGRRGQGGLHADLVPPR